MRISCRHWSLVALLIFICGACDKAPPDTISAKRAAAAAAPISAAKTQLLAVVSDQWDAFQATLYRYERADGESVVADFISGAVEAISPDFTDHDWDIIEGSRVTSPG